MRAIELVLVAVFGVLGIRSFVHWTRRPFESRDPRDHLFFAMFVTGRVGLWLSLSGLFALYASVNTRGRAFTDDVRRYDWYVMVFVVLAVVQLISGYFLGRRSAR